MLVLKADGVAQEFDEQKLIASLKRSGAEEKAARDVADAIKKELYERIPTHEIYARAFARLREPSFISKHRPGVAARYSLKRAVLDFGPTGFPFEAYIAEMFRAEGYSAKIDQIIQGECVEHEVDVLLEKDGKEIFVEAKFHNTLGFKTDLKTALYVQARTEDINRGAGFIVTNTKFTSKAVQYAQCKGLELLGWEYPEGNNLHDRVDKAGVYPITALASLSRREKTALLEQKVVLCKDIKENTRALAIAGISGKKADLVLEEAGALCIPGRDI